ncbi:MAG: NADH-quinone oxidoreductase subunit N [Chloroflexi bacterium]|nr:NADH-quinone oxidoreductase subunit N [Chloroflexota bacterium]
MVFPEVDFSLMAPQLIVLALALALIVVDLILLRNHERLLTWLSLIGFGGALVATIWLGVVGLPGPGGVTRLPSASTFGGMVRWDPLAVFFMVVILSAALLTVLISATYMPLRRMPLPEYLMVLALGTLGMMLTASAGDLVMIFIGIELSSVAIYVMTGFQRTREESLEAAIKYFLLGIFATAILVYGMAWLYGVTGHTNLTQIARYLTASQDLWTSRTMLFALLLLVVGLGFKAAAVPFHMWTPDAYTGAPTPVSAFLSVGPKAAAFVAIVRVLVEAMGPMAAQWTIAVMVLAVLTMTLGNVVAVSQRNIKRLLAYSSIAHTGYMLVGLASYRATETDLGVPSLLFYTFAYVFMNIGAFGVVIWVQHRGGGTYLEDYNGLASRAPLPALALAICLFSLLGVPPLLGFWAKYFVIVAAIEAGLVWLAVWVVVTSAISAYFYLRVIAVMYFGESTQTLRNQSTKLLHVGVGLSVLMTVAFGFASQPVLELARQYRFF